MSLDQVFQLIASFVATEQNLIAKVILIILLSFYVLFTIVISVQIRRLNNIVNQINFSPIFKFLALLHSLASIGLFVFVIFFL